MKPYYDPTNVNSWAFASVSAKLSLLAVVSLLLYPVALLFKRLPSPVPGIDIVASSLLIVAAALLILAGLIKVLTPPAAKIRRMVRCALYDPSRGNPFHLRRGDQLPRIRCKRIVEGHYSLTISAGQSVDMATIRAAASVISSALNHRFRQYAVTGIDQDPAGNGVTFHIENIIVDRTLTFKNAEEMCPTKSTLLTVQKGTGIDLTTSGSILVAGKTRSGKTTGIIALLIQVLSAGRDSFDSRVTIIDPKQAELSRLPHVVTLDEDSEARGILDAMKDFADMITHRQRILNDISEQKGDAVKWWAAGMKSSWLFLDEYVALRSIIPKKAAKDDEGYCLDVFDGLLKRIITMGASAGCFAVISIAEASVQEGGLPAMLRSAMSTRILFRPTQAEALLMWGKEKVENLPERVYGPGDAWFSSTDGVHEAVCYVHFPQLEFPVYRELGRLLKQYYEMDAGGGGSGAAAASGEDGSCI